MGCSRDRIALNHFAKNIVSLHLQTNISVNIIIYNDTSKHIRKGLSFEEFKLKLQESINQELKPVVLNNTEELGQNDTDTETIVLSKNNLLASDNEAILRTDVMLDVSNSSLRNSLNVSSTNNLNCHHKFFKVIT